jgi:hypothetical protein
MLLGIPGDNTYANMQEARINFLDQTVCFYLSLIVSSLSQWLLPDAADDLELGYDLDAVPAMVERRGQLYERVEKLSFVKLDEKRDLTGFGKLEKGQGDVVLVPSTMRPLEQALEPPAPPAPPGGALAGAAPGDKPAKPPKAEKPKKPKPAAAEDTDAKALADARFAALCDAPDTLRKARAAMPCSAAEFALWLISEEGLSVQQAKRLAALTEVTEAPAAG